MGKGSGSGGEIGSDKDVEESTSVDDVVEETGPSQEGVSNIASVEANSNSNMDGLSSSNEVTGNSNTEMRGGEINSKSSLESENEINEKSNSEILNEMHEVPKSPEEAEQWGNEFSQQAIETILANEGKYMSEADKARIEKGADKVGIEIYSGRGPTGNYSFHDGKSNVNIFAVDKGQIERTAMHENMHFASKNSEIIVPHDGGKAYNVYHTVGFHEIEYTKSTQTGEISNFKDTGRGFNEGINTMLTNEALSSVNEVKGDVARAQEIYGHATEVCEQLQEIIGEDAIKSGYFGSGRGQIAETFNNFVGQGSFDSFLQSLDKTIDRDYGTRVEGMKEAQYLLEKLEKGKTEAEKEIRKNDEKRHRDD